jgi:hypothetical protein
MRRISALLTFGALLASAGDASAAFYYVSNGTYFITGNVDPPAVHRVRAEGADVAFFTPVAGYQRTGFQCVPLVEVSKVNGKLSKRQGTACRSLNAR